MKKKNYYEYEKNINLLDSGKCTWFLDYKRAMEIREIVKNEVKIHYTFDDAERLVLYTNVRPDIALLEIESYNPLTHREIMGSIYGLNINYDMIGDIVIVNGHYYFYAFRKALKILYNDFNKVGNNPIKLKEVEPDLLVNYHREYESITLIVSSLRIDVIASKLAHTSRDGIKKKFLDGDIQVNYEEFKKPEYNMRENDVFSIRKVGKFKFTQVTKTNKKGNYVIEILKY